MTEKIESIAHALQVIDSLRAELAAANDGLLWLFYFAEQQEGFAAPEWLAGVVNAAISGGEER